MDRSNVDATKGRKTTSLVTRSDDTSSTPSPASSSGSKSGPRPESQPIDNSRSNSAIRGELHRIRTYINAIQTRVEYLQGLLDPDALDDIRAMKRAMKNTHRDLEKLQDTIRECDAGIALAEITRQAWRAYRALVRMEERMHRVVDGAKAKGKGKSTDKGKGRALEPEPEAIQRLVPSTYIPTGANASTKPTPRGRETYAPQGSGKNDTSMEERSNDERFRFSIEVSSDELDNYAVALKRRNAMHTPSEAEHAPVLIRSRSEVERNCKDEERADRPILRDPDRRREGSTANGQYATMLVMSGNDDEQFVMPKLRYIKMHEMKQLRGWLAEMNYVKRTGSISRMEKVLQLFVLLQEGCRIEKIAVLFSRTPRQVRQACREVMQGLLELHSETALPRRQPTCDGLWRISVNFFNNEAMVKKAEVYYGFEMWDVIKVLVTVNLFIGRFRQQGRLSLDGAYFHWWRSFRDVGQSWQHQETRDDGDK